MPEELFGIPSHPLMVHLPVVLLPLCALIALVLAVRPSFVRHYGWPFLGLSLVATIGTVLAASSGEGLEELLDERSDAIEQHAEWGDRTRLIAIVFFVLAAAFVYLVKRSQRSTTDSTGSTHTVVKRSPAIPVLAALLVVSAIGATASVIYTGHTGAKSAWEDAGKEGGGAESGGESDGD